MTLIELVIGISILLIVITLSFPKSNLDKYKIDSFAKQICLDIRYVRKNNTLNNSNTYLNIVVSGNEKGYILRENGKTKKKVSLPENLTLRTNMQSKLYFLRSGTPYPSGGTIEVGSQNYKKEITIVPVSGRVLVKEGEYE